MMQREFEKRGLLKVSHPFLLFILADAGGSGMPQCELAQRLGVAPSSTAVSIRRMEKAGLLSKKTDKADSRRNQISLTPKGRHLVDECRMAFEDIDRGMLAGFSRAERENLRSYYIRMIHNLEAMGAQIPSGLKGE